MPKIIGLQHVPKPEGISGEESLGADNLVQKRLSLIYQVLADNVDQNEDDILATAGLPVLGDRLRGATCRRRSAQEEDTAALLWNVTCDFDSRIEEGTEEDPEQRPPKWSWGYETIEKVLEYDAIDGKAKPIENSAEEPLILTAPIAIAVLTIEKIQKTFNPATIFTYVNHTNSKPFWGAPVGTALMAGISDTEEIIGGEEYRKVTSVIKFDIQRDGGALRENTWGVELLDHGTRYLKLNIAQIGQNNAPQWETFTDRQGNPTTGNLDGGGGKLPDNLDPVYLFFNRFPKADLNKLQLGPF